MSDASRIPAPVFNATYDDLLAAPENMVAELISGVLYTHPRPAGPHAETASVLGMDVGGAFHRGRGGPGGWIILYEPEVHFGSDVLVPDVAGWRRERMATVPPDHRFTISPDWACEVLSPSTALLDRRNKLPIYAAASVPHVWLVDPTRKSVEVLALDGESYRLKRTAGDREVVRLEPFDAIELELAALWPSQLEENTGNEPNPPATT